MISDMIYDGQKIVWSGKGAFKATSGLPGYQEPDYYCVPESGPIPEGFYKIYLENKGVAKDDGTGSCTLSPAWGIQQIPRGVEAGDCEQFWINWGNNRARMEPADSGTKIRCSPIMRGGFYLHDSSKGYSHGCIEVERRIFPLLRQVSKNGGKSFLVVKVAYQKGVPTNGGTKI